MRSNAHEVIVNGLGETLKAKGIPFSTEIASSFSEVMLGNIENITNLLEKKDERRHQEVLLKMENEFKETEIYANLNMVGVGLCKEVISQCLKFYEKALDSCIELEKELTSIITNSAEDNEVRIKAIDAQVDIQKNKFDSNNKNLVAGLAAGVATIGIAVLGSLGNKKLNMEREKNTTSLIKKIFG